MEAYELDFLIRAADPGTLNIKEAREAIVDEVRRINSESDRREKGDKLIREIMNPASPSAAPSAQ